MLILISTTSLFSRGDDKQTSPLPNTKPLELKGDIAAEMVAGIDKFLLREIYNSVERRAKHWKRGFSSAEAYNKSVEPNRKRLAHILGVRDQRVPFDGLELLSSTARPALVGKGASYKIYAVRWPVFRDIHGEGLLLVPNNKDKIVANVVAIPDADQSPEQFAGLTDGLPAELQFARRLAESGCRVVVPTLVSREMKRRAPPGQSGRANLTNREYIHRSAFELGRHLIGYELQKVLAVVDWFEKEAGDDDAKIGVVGYGEGGMLALYSAALDTRIDASYVSGYFENRNGIWQQPIDRNVFGLLTEFGDAELASLVIPRYLIVDATKGPQVSLPSEGGAPATLNGPDSGKQEFERLLKLVDRSKLPLDIHFSQSSDEAFDKFSKQLTGIEAKKGVEDLSIVGGGFDPNQRQGRQVDEIDRHNQWLLRESPYVRRDFMNIGLTGFDKQDGSNKLDTSSPEAYEKSVERFREFFRHEVVGHFDYDLLPFNARSRKTYDEEKWTGYEVALDVFPDVFAYGILCLPKDLKQGEKRPVVVCQHGLEGRPQDIVTGDHRAYHDFASKLAERGFITFAPQNIYIGRDKFRTLQRKAYPLKKTLFSIMVPQHQQIVNWLKSLPNVDPDRIAFYGLSYGGKSAMRIPPLVTDYCLSICSADFNEWVWKNASTRARHSYVWTGEYEIFEFDLGSTFNYAEMAALIAPRPFMVERGHFDGVAPDETVAYEFGKVRHLYAARLSLPDRCEIDWFVGPHTINGKGTFDFLHKHLNWPKR
jgi:dienelactone hydrolase